MTRPLKLESLERLGWRFGLETIRALLEELGNPQLALRVVHVAGSNGKGSTCAYLASFLKNAGYRTGLYTSPHLSDLRERFRINGEWISEADLRKHTRRVLEACRRVWKRQGRYPTHFEALTAVAFSWFKEERADWVVLEVGLGGRLDATNVIPCPAVALITPIGLEHQEILGKTLEKIAYEKAGILKEGGRAATVQIHAEALKSIQKEAVRRGAVLWVGGRDFTFRNEGDGLWWEGPGFTGKIPIQGLNPYQVPNAALALAGIQALRAYGIPAEVPMLQKSFSAMRWPGRFEALRSDPPVILDGAHNPDAARVLAGVLSKKYPGKRWVVLNGFLKDKDYGTFAGLLRPLAQISIVTEPPSERKEEGGKVFRAWEKLDVRTLLIKDWERALAFAKYKSGRYSLGLLITGSLYLGGACRKVLAGLQGLEKI